MSDLECDKCHFFTGHANTRKNNKDVFICDSCKSGIDKSIEIAEMRMGA